MTHPEQRRIELHDWTIAGCVIGLALILACCIWLAPADDVGQEPVEQTNGVITVLPFVCMDDTFQDYVWIYIDIPDGRMLYSMNQVPGAPVTPLEILPEPSPDWKVGTFEAVGPPARMKMVGDTPIYYHIGQIVYNAPVSFRQGFDRKKMLELQGSIKFGVCGEDYCLPPQTQSFTARVRK